MDSRLTLYAAFAMILIVAGPSLADEGYPQQIYLAITGNPTEMVVTWASTGLGDDYIEYGREANNLNLTAQVTTRNYEWVLLIHEALLTELEPSASYHYRVGEPERWSPVYTFDAAPAGPTNVTIGIVADQGTSDEAKQVTNIMTADNFDIVIFPGDLSYANALQPLWDGWAEQITPVAAEIPYMFAPGNHENEPGFDFAAYEERFYRPSTASNSDSPFYYSFNFSSVHFVSISSEHDYNPGSAQYQWLAHDLAVADQDRQIHPWVILFVHRPFYSSSNIHGSEAPLRDSIEELLLTYHVDMTLAGHEHNFERTYPVYNDLKLSNATGTYDDPYIDPSGPIHAVVGTGGGLLYGTLPLTETFDEHAPAWSAYREEVHGYSRLHVTNNTLHFEFVHTDGLVAHEFWIVRTVPPQVFIEEIVPSPAELHDDIILTGRKEGGVATGYLWSSSIDGELGDDITITTTLTVGHHIISFTAQDERGNWVNADTMTLWIYALPEAKTTANITATIDSTIWFNGTGNDADGEIALYEWDLDGDGIFEWSSSENGITFHIYGNSGIYATVLRITDNDGFSAFDSRIITIELPEDNSTISILILVGSIIFILAAIILRMKLK